MDNGQADRQGIYTHRLESTVVDPNSVCRTSGVVQKLGDLLESPDEALTQGCAWSGTFPCQTAQFGQQRLSHHWNHQLSSQFAVHSRCGCTLGTRTPPLGLLLA
jgi:hypothetical protein